jgi:hypothetical protein
MTSLMFGAEGTLAVAASVARRSWLDATAAEKGCCLVTDRAVGDVLQGDAAAGRETA